MYPKFCEVERTQDRLTPLEKVKTYIPLVKYIMPTMASMKDEEENQDDVLRNYQLIKYSVLNSNSLIIS